MRLPASCAPLALGCAAFGNLYEEVSRADVEVALQSAWLRGIRLFDVAPHYGLGLAEERLGAFLQTVPRNEVIVSTKIGRLLVDVEPGEEHPDTEGFAVTRAVRRRADFSREGVRRSLRDSCRRLGLDRVDIALIHDPENHMSDAFGEAYPELVRHRDSGAVDFIGVGTSRLDVAERFVRETDIDVLLLAGRYTLLDQSAGQLILPLCAERGIDVLAAGVLNSGILGLESPASGAMFDYAPAPPAVVARAQAVAAACMQAGLRVSMAATAFPLTNPAITAVISGARSANEVEEAHRAVTAGISPSVLRRVSRGAPCAS
jgi:D-threo-aldose 1-dehydrogenase